MPGISETRTLDAVLTTTMDNYRKTLYDNIFDNYPLLSWTNGKLGQAMRGGSIKRVLDGGNSIYEHLLYGTNSTAKSYSGAESLDTTTQDGMTMANFVWKQYAATISITGIQKRNNSGEAAMINLLESKIKQAEMSLKDLMSQGAWGDGTGNGAKVLTGLQAIVSATTSLGGINPTTYTWWKSNVTSTAGSFAAGGLGKMRTTFNTLSMGNDKPDIIFCDQNVYEYYEAALQPIQRITNTKAADGGFENLTFKGIPIIFDRDCPSGYMYFLNSKYLNLVVHRDADMATTPFITTVDQDITSSKILFQGNMTTNNRRMLGVITGFTA